ncbi:MAG: leucyl aminopeptidase [Bacteroidetes bacterium]|nr:leucyl aminopeptidase [Bacteroidota bacterium]
MLPKISITKRSQEIENLVLVVSSLKALPDGVFTASEMLYIRRQHKELKKDIISYNRLENWIYVYVIKDEKADHKRREECRKAGDKVGNMLNSQKAEKVVIFDHENHPAETLAFAEGMALGNYQFLKYKQDKEKKNTLRKIEIYSGSVTREPGTGSRDTNPDRLNIVNEAVYKCRDLINEPASYLTATVFSKEIEKLGKDCGAKVEVMNKKKLEVLQMGGILGVNKGSHEPPTFTVMEWKPADAVNKKPIVLVGKGIVFDSGGMNLKPGDSMLNMKDDMSGAAAVALAVYAIAKAKLPVYVVGLMPATDNRLGTRAIVPGDVLKMHNGMTVEVLNTDAEGRLILADALSYARKYKPELVIDMATLTGAAVRAIGKFACAGMEARASEELLEITDSGFRTCERIVELPMWDEYGELIKSEFADLKNLGPGDAGTITAGKFLEKFTDYPYIHLDIAGPAFLDKADSYRGIGGTGFGVRLLFDYIMKRVN